MRQIEVEIIKKDGTRESYNIEKVIGAVNKSADRATISFTEEEINSICDKVNEKVAELNKTELSVDKMHYIVENVLDELYPEVAKNYKDYRNYKTDFVSMLDKVYKESQRIMYLGDKSNANADSALVTTKRSLIFGELSKELYKKFFLNADELQAIKDGYIYAHDISSRLLTTNCCICDMKTILDGGFELANIWYNEPKSLDVAFGVIADVTMSASGCQYGGFSIGEVDKLLEPYAEKSYNSLVDKYVSLGLSDENAKQQAFKDIERMAEQGFQEWEYKFNTLSSARGDFSFISTSFGLGKSKICKMLSKKIMEVRAKGEGKEGNKKPVLFPKLIFLYDENLHGEGKELEDVFNSAVECNKKSMYPDYVSLSADNYVSNMYQQYGMPITPMGCVDGKEVIVYKYNDTLYTESFERMWDRISKDIDHLGQNSDGDIHRYFDLSDLDIKIYDTKKQDFVKLKRLIRNMSSDWCDVKMSNGRKLRVTYDHPFATENRGVVLAKDLQLGDSIIINPSYPNIDKNIEIAKSLAWLYGVMLCDGCYQSSNIFGSFAYEGEDDIINNFISSFKDNFGVDCNIIEQKRGKKGNYKDIRVLSNENKSLKELEEYFTTKFEGVQKIYRHIPNEVFNYTKECRLAFLAGMIDADGYINKPKNRNYCIVQIGSTNKELSIQQMLLAQSLGMFAKIYENHYDTKDSNKIRYRVEFYPTEELMQHMVCQKKIAKFVKNNIHTATECKVTQVNHLSMKNYSYDVTTDSEHFEVSGVYSHNCRSFLSPWFKNGGFHKQNEEDTPIFVGRGNIGVISLNMPMIYKKAEHECKDFYEVLDYYLEMIRKLHLKTLSYLGNMKASCNPLMYMEGGFYGGKLKANDKIAPILKSFTTSFGVTALNELNILYNGKTIAEDGEFPLQVMNHMNAMVDKFKEEDGVLHSIYYAPAESLCHTQVLQFKEKYGIIEGVSDREYMTNGFHCHVSEDITPTTKQDLEKRFLDTGKGGQIFFNKFNCNYNTEAFKTLIRRAMKNGFYYGTNLNLSYCENCGFESIEMTKCDKCGSENITSINRVCGYLGFSKVKGETRFNEGKLAETKDRVSY